MLVWPDEINVHRIKNPRFISEVKPSPLPSASPVPAVKSGMVDLSARKELKSVQPPMKFGSYQTGTERLAVSIMQNQGLDTSPTKRTALGSDQKVLNLRPEDHTRMLGRPGHLRVKAQSSIQQQLDRMSMERPKVLDVDPGLSKAYRNNTIEHGI